MIVVFITLLLDLFETARVRRDQRTITAILKKLDQ